MGIEEDMSVDEKVDRFWKRTLALKREVCEKEISVCCAEQEDRTCVSEDCFAGDRK
jgi:hypothetical protein